MVSQEKLNRLFWHSRRGMLELDLILVPFVRNHYANLDEKNQELYDRFIEEEDQDLFSWLIQRTIPEDAEFSRLITIILDVVDPSKS